MAKTNGKDAGQALKNVYLTGFMCAGKTSSGRALARRLRRTFLDSDIQFGKKYGAPAASIIREKGLGRFRSMETALVKDLACGNGRIIGLGGGIYASPKWERLLKKTGVTIFLHCPWPVIEERLKAARAGRPLLDGPWQKAALRAKKLYTRRLCFYRRADITVATGRLTPAQVSGKIKSALAKYNDLFSRRTWNRGSKCVKHEGIQIYR